MESALAKVESLAVGVWTRERVDLIKRTVCPKGITDDEFALFVEQCRRSGLDPLLKQAFCVPRRQNVGTRDAPRWIEKHEFQPSEAGMLARAEDFPDLRGISAAAVYEKDEILIDAGAGTVSHKFKPGPDRGKLLGAWALLARADRLPLVVWLDLPGYQQSTPLWGRMPATMIEKCARVAVLRKAYPGPFGGLYTEDEPQPEHDEPAPQEQAHADGVVTKSEPVPVKTFPKLPPEPPAEDKARRARADRIWRAFKATGGSKEAFADFLGKVLGAQKPSTTWTDDDMGHIEAAMAAEAQLAREQTP